MTYSISEIKRSRPGNQPLLFWVIWCSFLSGISCQSVETIGYVQNDTSLFDTNTETNTEITQDTDFKEYTRIPFLVSNLSDSFLRVHAEDNLLGLTGAWYDYNDVAGTTNKIYFDDQGNACAKGEVVRYDSSGSSYTHAGIGAGLCFDPEQSVFCYTLARCPYIENVDFEIVGVSFEIWNNSSADLRLLFLQQPSLSSSYLDIQNDGNNTEYLISDAEILTADELLTFENISNIQIQVQNSETENVPFDFCVREFSLLIK